ncbi:DciA family protein [Coralloluteibacterium thermophilus]|uniref:DciA family protein n=1 Tax=Coralloluteibacterium thermophilum TaxID=2707049 RepID=A0ABV9NPD1_9GAMM
MANDPGLDRLIERAQWLDALDRRLRQSLPAPLADHCRLGNVRGDRLVFLVGSAAWSTKLRLHADDILSAARALGLPAGILSVKIVSTQPIDRRPEPCLPLSAAARESLKAAAAGVSDPGLREQLLRLSEV